MKDSVTSETKHDLEIIYYRDVLTCANVMKEHRHLSGAKMPSFYPKWLLVLYLYLYTDLSKRFVSENKDNKVVFSTCNGIHEKRYNIATYVLDYRTNKCICYLHKGCDTKVSKN